MDSWVTNASMDLSTVEYDQARGAGARGVVPGADAPPSSAGRRGA